MKTTTLTVITALFFTAVTADPTGQMTYFAAVRNYMGYAEFYIIREGEGVIASFDPPSWTEGLTYDGEHWWMIKQPEETIYCFDYGGDYVTSFPAPAPYPSSLAWDGEYLWIGCGIGDEDVRLYQYTSDGEPGPYNDFVGKGGAGLTVFNDQIVTLWTIGLSLHFYAKDGTFVRSLYLEGGSMVDEINSLTSDGEYLWVNFREDSADYNITGKFDPYTGAYLGVNIFYGRAFGLSSGIWSYTEIGTESFGKIKAFFEDK